jgi:hypothetical protein
MEVGRILGIEEVWSVFFSEAGIFFWTGWYVGSTIGILYISRLTPDNRLLLHLTLTLMCRWQYETLMNSAGHTSLLQYRSLREELSLTTTIDCCMTFLAEADTTPLKVAAEYRRNLHQSHRPGRDD